MTPYILLIILYFTSGIGTSYGDRNRTQPCYGNQANYDMQKAMGSWYVVALIPETGFPKLKRISCYKMDVSETDEAGLRWLISRKIESPNQEVVQKIKGTIVRQRYHSETPFDIWSKAITGINGCFRQLFSLGTNKTNISDAENLATYMQLHLMDTNDGAGPYLVQILWGKLISAVIYRREEGVSMERLEPIHKYITDLKGYQMPPLICNKPEKEIKPPASHRP
ncbi:uncharacterized protein LOC123663846 isoform X1 [Melitaea cinxia]|uniref:uncharacterized protein LOC123663846 isoform X1 n=1 Tax=Melitaea cinxia TaxID=113334 RepID=UPI001E270F34|nr:uncharacterized protein LOC123663846 isoform X1 [Melitaea cinxia]